MTFGEALSEARGTLGWTQHQLAKAVYAASDGKVDLTPPEISRYERGRVLNPRIEVLLAVARATGNPVSYFLGEDVPSRVAILDEATASEGAAA